MKVKRGGPRWGGNVSRRGVFAVRDRPADRLTATMQAAMLNGDRESNENVESLVDARFQGLARDTGSCSLAFVF